MLPSETETLMFNEAASSAAVIAAQFARNRDVVQALAADLRQNPPPFVVTCARGSSDHAATYAKYLFETRLGVVTASASLCSPRLPFPAVVEPLDFEVIYAAMKAQFALLLPEYTAWLESDPAQKLLQLAAYRELGVRQRVNDSAKAVTLAYAVGSDLDHIAARYNVQRLLIDPGDALATPRRAGNSIPARIAANPSSSRWVAAWSSRAGTRACRA